MTDLARRDLPVVEYVVTDTPVERGAGPDWLQIVVFAVVAALVAAVLLAP